MTDYRNQFGLPVHPRFPWYWVLGVGVVGVVIAVIKFGGK